jgi:hypothetical protein
VQEQTTQLDDLQLVALPSAVGCAGLFVQFTLGEWRLGAVVADATEAARELVRSVVELVDEDDDVPVPILLRLRLRGSALTVEVELGPVPEMGEPAALAGRTGGVQTLRNGRQRLWCKLALPGGMHATSVALPRRTTRAARVETRPAPAEVEFDGGGVDVDVMRRILSSLGRNTDG